MTIPLGPPLPTGSSCQPGPLGLKHPCGAIPCGPARARPLFGIAPGGACRAVRLPRPRWALTPPFHPYPGPKAGGGLFSVALSLGLPRPGVTRHPCFMESGLSSRSSQPPRSSGHPRAPSLRRAPPPRQRGKRRARASIVRRVARRQRPAAQGRNRSRNAASTASQSPPAPDSQRPAPPPRETPPDPTRRALRPRPDRPAPARQPPPVEPRARIALAPRRHVGMRDHPLRRNAPPRHRSRRSNASSAAICGSGKGGKPSSPAFASSIPIEREFTSVTAAPGARPGMPGPRRLVDQRQTSAVLGDQVMRRDLRRRVAAAAPAPPRRVSIAV